MRFQFTLQTLLLSAVVIWSSMAAFGPGGLVPAAIILATVAYTRSSESMWRAAAIVFLILLFGCCLLLPPLSPHQESFLRSWCINNLKGIAVALHNYHDDHGCFPPAYIADENGKPMHSWRVLLLPYIEQQVLYQQYKFSEPWDGPNNRKLAAPIPAIYQCRSAETRTGVSPVANYLAVVGPETAWPGAKAGKLSSIGDGPHNTIMLVEVANSDVNWMEPRDLSFEEALRGINPSSGMGISSRHVWGENYYKYGAPAASVAFADGIVRPLPEGIPVEILEALLTVDGGENIDREHCGDYWPPPRLKWGNCVAVAALVVSTLLLLLRPRRREPRGPLTAGLAPGKPGR